MTALTAWYLSQLDAHGVVAVLAAQLAMCLATIGTIGAAWAAADRSAERRRIDETTFIEADHGTRAAETYANTAARKETP